MKCYLSALFCFFITLSLQAQTVSNIATSYHDGQIFITWKNIPSADTGFYYVYRNSVPITSANIQSSTYLGRVLHNFAYDYRFTFADPDHVPRYLITNDNPYTILDSTQNLFVVNCTHEGAKSYYAVRCNFGNTGQNYAITPGANATVTPIMEHLDPIRCYTQATGIIFPGAKNGETLDVYIHYGTNVAAGSYPAMCNEGCLAFHFGIIKSGPVGAKNSCYLKFHGGNGDFIRNVLTVTIDSSWKISFDDWVPAYGLDSTGYNTRWFGYHEKFDVYGVTKDSPTPKTGKIKSYTLNRVLWELNWIDKKWPGTLDSQRIYLNGSSQGCAAVLLNSVLFPSKYAAGVVQDGKFNMASPNDDNPDCKYNDDAGGRTETRIMWGNEDSTNLITDVPTKPGGSIYYKIYNLTNMNTMFSTNKDIAMPFLEAISGKNDNNTCWEEKVGVYKSVQKFNTGGIFQWDLRGHGGGDTDKLWPSADNPALKRFRTNLTYPAFAYCSLDGNPGDTNNPNPPYFDGDTVGSLHANVDWVDNEIIDAVDVWQLKLYIKQDSLLNNTAFPVVLPPSATTSVTIRRAQNFKGFPNNTQLCWSNTHKGILVQKGIIKQKYAGTNPKSLTINNVKVYSDSSIFRVEICSPLKPATTSLPAVVSESSRIYPNPFSNELTLQLSLSVASDVEVTIYNAIGEHVYDQKFTQRPEGENYLPLNTPALQTGIYFVHMKSSGEEHIYKVVKE